MGTAITYAGVTGLAIGYKPTRTVGLRMGSYGLRASANLYRGALLGRGPGLFGTTLLRGGTMTLGSAVGSVAAGYVIGATVGTAISYGLYGDDGARDAMSLYTGQVSFDEYYSTVSSAIKQTFF